MHVWNTLSGFTPFSFISLNNMHIFSLSCCFRAAYTITVKLIRSTLTPRAAISFQTRYVSVNLPSLQNPCKSAVRLKLFSTAQLFSRSSINSFAFNAPNFKQSTLINDL
uniref:Uncharacterized protein n=1 Tax=Arundo donax TaxID=35708 RepID=A0A0A9DG98_ARUDO